MTPTHTRSPQGWQQAPPQETPRLRLKPKAPLSGRVDGAWWPHSDTLEAEVPDLLAVLSVRLGPITYVLYKMTEWVKAPAKMLVGDRTVRLAGYQRQPDHTVEVQGINGGKVVLLVVPAATEPERAHDIMMAAATPDDASTTEELLAPAQV